MMTTLWRIFFTISMSILLLLSSLELKRRRSIRRSVVLSFPWFRSRDQRTRFERVSRGKRIIVRIAHETARGRCSCLPLEYLIFVPLEGSELWKRGYFSRIGNAKIAGERLEQFSSLLFVPTLPRISTKIC